MVDRFSEKIGSSRRVTTQCMVDKQEKTSRYAYQDDGKMAGRYIAKQK